MLEKKKLKMMQNNGHFKKGHKPWNKGKSVRLNPKTEFQKGKNHPYYGKKKKDLPGFKGYRTINSCGYVLIFKPDHVGAFPSGYVLEHRYKMSKKLKRKLKKNEVVHHIDGNRQNNKLENLLLMTKSQHIKFHMMAYDFIFENNLYKSYLKWFFKNV